jgi:hypothetical protein
MRHTVEIADTDGNTMQLSIAVDNFFGHGGSWRSLTKGMIKHNSGFIREVAPGSFGIDHTEEIWVAGENVWGIKLDTFMSWDTVNDQGTGTLAQPWHVGLKPGAIEWSIVP